MRATIDLTKGEAERVYYCSLCRMHGILFSLVCGCTCRETILHCEQFLLFTHPRTPGLDSQDVHFLFG